MFESLHCGCLGSSLVTATDMRSLCRRLDSRSGHLSFSRYLLFSFVRDIRVYSSEVEQFFETISSHPKTVDNN